MSANVSNIKADIQLIESKIAVKMAEINKLTLQKEDLQARLGTATGGEK
jgi:regulator of replication initiation timing